MMTLYDRLNSKHKKMLDEELVKYPFSIGFLVKDLKSNYIYTDLTYSNICILVNHLNLRLYDPQTINQLFDENN